MRVNRSLTRRTILASLIGIRRYRVVPRKSAQAPAPSEPRQPVAIQFTLDRPIDAAAAPFVMAAVSGLFSAEGLAVTTNVAGGSSDAIARVGAGSSDFAVVDINALIRSRDNKAAAPVKAVFVLFNQAPTPSSPVRAAASRRCRTSRARTSASPKAICLSGSGRR